jgi:DNA-binding NarL/FixJ family response regulator
MASSVQNPIRLLVVEDHQLMRMSIKTLLKRQSDFVVIGDAENGAIAVHMVDELLPDVVAMDVGMPVMDGIEASRRIIARHPSVHILMLTHHDNDNDIFAALAAGATGYCMKDSADHHLYSAVRSVHSGDMWLDSAIAKKVLERFCTSKKPVSLNQSPTPSDGSKETAFEPRSGNPFSSLEIDVLKLMVEGHRNQEIADRLRVSLSEAKDTVRQIFNKLEVHDMTMACVQAMRKGII